MTQNKGRGVFDGSVTLIGVLIGLLVGAIYAMLHIKNRGETTRKNLTQFGAASVEMGIDSSLHDAKKQARQRVDDLA